MKKSIVPIITDEKKKIEKELLVRSNDVLFHDLGMTLKEG